jgi:cytochrome bd ubiquinol oxidase subunit II
MNPTGLEALLLGAIGAGLTLYLLFGGADFGGGVWDLLARGPAHQRERNLIAAAIGPVWEANHVWLIFVVTLLFAAFPLAFSTLSIALYLPFSIAIAGIVLRGAAFAFRTYGERGTGWQRRWTRVFGIASLVTPLVFGMAAAAISSGRIRVHGASVEAPLVGAWTGPLSLIAGPLVVAMCAYLAATYLTVEAHERDEPDLENAFRLRAIVAAVVAGVLALAGLVLMPSAAPILWAGMRRVGWPLAVVSAVGGVGSVAAHVTRRFQLARMLAAVAVVGVVAGWGVAQWPRLIVPDVTVGAAAAPNGSLRPVAIGSVIGGLLLAPSLLLLFRVFKGSRYEA